MDRVTNLNREELETLNWELSYVESPDPPTGGLETVLQSGRITPDTDVLIELDNYTLKIARNKVSSTNHARLYVISKYEEVHDMLYYINISTNSYPYPDGTQTETFFSMLQEVQPNVENEIVTVLGRGLGDVLNGYIVNRYTMDFYRFNLIVTFEGENMDYADVADKYKIVVEKIT